MTARRDFLRASAAALAAGTIAPRLLRALDARANADHIDRIGLQLYTVRAAMKENVERTLARVAAIGYKEVEFAGYFGRTPSQIKASLEANGLDGVGAHVSLADVRSPDWPRTVDAARAMGFQYLIVAWLDENERASQATYGAVADSLIAASDAAAGAGITVGYHNYNYEFTPLNGKQGLTVLLERTAGSRVVFEMDIHWITSAGEDPVAWFARWPGRFPLVHVKDSAGPPKFAQRDLGAGVTDWKRVLGKHALAGVKHYFVESDDAADPFASAAASYDYLTRLEF